MTTYIDQPRDADEQDRVVADLMVGRTSAQCTPLDDNCLLVVIDDGAEAFRVSPCGTVIEAIDCSALAA